MGPFLAEMAGQQTGLNGRAKKLVQKRRVGGTKCLEKTQKNKKLGRLFFPIMQHKCTNLSVPRDTNNHPTPEQ